MQYYGFMGLTIYYMLKRNYKKQLVIKEEKPKKYYNKKKKKKDDIMLFVSGLPTNARPLKSKLHQLFKPYVNNKRFKIKLGVNNLNHGLGFALLFHVKKTLENGRGGGVLRFFLISGPVTLWPHA